MYSSIARVMTLAGVTLLSTAVLAQDRNVPNSVKYKDSSIPNARGRAGDVSIEARALLNRDLTTDIEVTTGSFDGGAASGTISKLQLDFPSGGTQNFNNLASGGTYSVQVGGLIRHDRVGIQANVGGLSTPGTHVVSVEEIVKLRPDLLIASFYAPESAVLGRPVTVRATVREANGDVGARANCRLLADGVQVDTAEGIWVDAGGTVECAFAPTFQTAGNITLTVVVDGMNPGDWDDANNSATTQLIVRSGPEPFSNPSASASETVFDEYTYMKRSWTESSTARSGVAQSFHFNAMIPRQVNQSSLTFALSAESDGQLLAEETVTDFATYNVGPPGEGLRCSVSQARPTEVEVCYDYGSEQTSILVSFSRADATYRSWGWATRQHPWAPEEPMFTWDRHEQTDTLQARFGNTVSMHISMNDGATEWAANPFIPSLQTSTQTNNIPYRCSFDFSTEETVCRERRSTSTIRSGSATSF